MVKVLFVYNPAAGQGKIRSCLSDIIDVLMEAGYEVEIYATQKERDALAKVEKDAERYDRIFTSGGDGTLDEVITGLMRSGVSIPVGYLPAGSTNDFGSSLGIVSDLVAAARAAVAGKVFHCDIGRFNGGYFVYVAAFGLFTEASYTTSQDLKNALGYIAYVIEGAKELVNIPAYQLEADCDGEHVDGEFLFGMITNATYIGGVKGLVPEEVALNDGLLEVTLVSTPKNPVELTEILGYFMNINRDTKLVYTCQAKNVHIRFEEAVAWTLDGEFGGEHEEVLIETIPSGMEILV